MRLVLVAALLACLALAVRVFSGPVPEEASPAALRTAPAPKPARAGAPNVLLFSIDTLRADHLGFAGYERDTSPHLDRLARRSVRFREALAPAPWTLPSHAALLTGVHPRQLGIEDRWHGLPEEAPRLAEALHGQGYQTAAFVDATAGDFIGARRGFAEGFESYRHLPDEAPTGFRYDMRETADQAIRWLREGRDGRPFFLFLHSKSVHALPSSESSPDPRAFPYDKPPEWRDRFLRPEWRELSWVDPELGKGVQYLREVNERIAAGEMTREDLPEERVEALRALYDAGIAYVDHHFARVLEALRAAGVEGETIVVVTSDHGEAFLEHELLLHKEIHRQLLHVPLLVHLPWLPDGREIEERVSLMQVAPTVLALAGAPVPESMDHPPLPLGEPDDVQAGPERAHFTYYRSRDNYYYEGYGLREGPFSLVRSRLGRQGPWRTRLYDLSEDPEEQHPLEGHDARRAHMLARLEAWIETGKDREAPSIEADGETLRHLRALGYVE